MAHFLHVFVKPNHGVSRNDIETVLNKAKDWIRYGDGVYIVYTGMDSATWKRRLIGLAKPDGYLFIAELDMKAAKGFMASSFWDWVKSKTEA